MIRLDKVKKVYDGFELNCSLEVKPGCITGLIGKNGAGKSTTFKAIMGILNIDDGELTVLGEKVMPGANTLSKETKALMGVAMPYSGFSTIFTLKDANDVLAKSYKNHDKEKFAEMCRNLGLPMNKKLSDFSTGMQAKAKAAMAMCHEAKLLILDEPTSGLDVVARGEIIDMIRDYMTDDRAVLISSHISTDLESLCDDIYMIEKGQIVVHEDTDVLLSKYGVLKYTKEQAETLDKTYIIDEKEETFGYVALTNEVEFYKENYPQIIIEKGKIDDLLLMIGGARK